MTANSSYEKIIQEGFSAPPQDVCQGWYLRNRANNAELSELVPAAHLYAVMTESEIENLSEYIDDSVNPAYRGVLNASGRNTPVWINDGGNEVPFDTTNPTLGREHFERRLDEINSQLTREIIQATVKYSYSTSEEKTADLAAGKVNLENIRTTQIGLVQLAQIKSQANIRNDIRGASSSVGIDNLSTKWTSGAGYSKIIEMALTFTNPDVIDINYAYQKLLTVNTKYIIVYGWYNGTGGNSIFSPQTTDPIGNSSQNFASYPSVKGFLPGEKTIEIDLTNQNTGGFFSAQQMVLQSYNFNTNDLGQMEGTFKFIDQTANWLINTPVSTLSKFIKNLVNSGETLSDVEGFSTGDATTGEFLGDVLAPEVDSNQQLVFNGISNLLFNTGLKDVHQTQADAEASENDSLWGDATNILGRLASAYADSTWPYGGPGIVQYEVNRKPITVFGDPDPDDEDTEVEETVYQTEYQSRTNFYYLGWLMEAVRYGMSDLSSADSRRDYVNEGKNPDRFGVNFYYEEVPEDSLFGMQYKRLVDDTQIKSNKAVVRKVMSFIEESALPSFNVNREYMQFLNSAMPGMRGTEDTVTGRRIKDFLNIRVDADASRLFPSGNRKYEHRGVFDKGAFSINKIQFAPRSYLDHKSVASTRVDPINTTRSSGEERIPGADANAEPWLSTETFNAYKSQYGEEWVNTEGVSIIFYSSDYGKLNLGQGSNGRGSQPWVVGHVWLPAFEWMEEKDPIYLQNAIAVMRYFANKTLFESTMKKWWIEHRKALLRDIQEKVSDRLLNLAQQGKTVLDILKEPIDLEWLTSRKPVSLNAVPATMNRYGSHIGSSYGAHAGSLRLGRSASDNLHISAISSRYNEEGGESGDSEYGPGSLPNESEENWEQFWNKIYKFITGKDGRAMHQALVHFDPYSPEIPDFSDDDEISTMEVLDLLWDTRAYNGRGGITNYGPNSGGQIYDRLTGLSFVPQNIGLDNVEWAERNPFLRKEMFQLFNQYISSDNQLNILSLLDPSFEIEPVGQIHVLTEEEMHRNQEKEEEIDNINVRLTERTIYSLMIPNIIAEINTAADETETAEVDNKDNRIEALEQNRQLADTAARNSKSWSAFRRQQQLEYQKATWEEIVDSSGRVTNRQITITLEMPEYQADPIKFWRITYWGRYGISSSNFGEYLTLITRELARLDDIDELYYIPGGPPSFNREDFISILTDFFALSAGQTITEKVDFIRGQLMSPTMAVSNYYYDFNNVANQILQGEWSPSLYVIQKIVENGDPGNNFYTNAIDEWFAHINDVFLRDTSTQPVARGIFQRDLNNNSYNELFEILREQNEEDVRTMAELRQQIIPGIKPEDVVEVEEEDESSQIDRINRALDTIALYFARLRNSEMDDTEEYFQQTQKPPIYFYLTTNAAGEKTTLISQNREESLEPRFEVLYWNWPGDESYASDNSPSEGRVIGHNTHDVGLLPHQKQSLVRNYPARGTEGDQKTAQLSRSAQRAGYHYGPVPNRAIPGRTLGFLRGNQFFAPYADINSKYSRYDSDFLYQDSRGHSSEGVTIFGYVSQFDGLGQLKDGTESFVEVVSDGINSLEEGSYIITPEDGDSFAQLVGGSGPSINKKYGRYMSEIMALNNHQRRIIIREKQRVDGGTTNTRFTDPTYEDALGKNTGANTYGDIRNKVPQSVADIAIRRDVVDNMLRPNNHKMNLMQFVNQLVAPTAIAAIGGTAQLMLRNVGGIMSIKPLGITQDGHYENYTDMVIDAVEKVEDPTIGYFHGTGEPTEAATNLIKSFYIYHKKQFSLVNSVSIAAEADNAYVGAQMGNNSRWFDEGFSRNFLEFLGWGNVASEFRQFVAERVGPSSDEPMKNDEGEVYENFAGELIRFDQDGVGNEKIIVDSNLMQQLPRKYISEFVGGFGRDTQMTQYYLAQHAADISSLYKTYMKRINVSIHGTGNIMAGQSMFVDNVLPGMGGVFNVIKCNETLNNSSYTTNIECEMAYQKPPKLTLAAETNTSSEAPAEE